MKLEFRNRYHIEVSSVFGYPEIVFGRMRDVLRIEISNGLYTLDELLTLFRDNESTRIMYLYDENDTKNLLGEGYQLFVKGSIEQKQIFSSSNNMNDSYIDIYVIEMAKLTDEEYDANEFPGKV